jgi:hypothetical protein
VVKHLHWVPHTLTPTQKTEPATLSIELLRQLRSIEHHSRQFIITLDESWFYLSTDHEQIRLRVEEQPPERPRHTIQDSEMTVAIAWNPLGFHLFDALPKGNTFNAEYYRGNITIELLPFRPHVDGRDSLFMLTKQDLTPPENVELFAKTVGSASPYTHHIHMLSHRPTSFSSEISNIVCRESHFHHVKNDMQQLMKLSGPFRDKVWRTYFGTGRRESNWFLRIMVITIHNLKTG